MTTHSYRQAGRQAQAFEGNKPYVHQGPTDSPLDTILNNIIIGSCMHGVVTVLNVLIVGHLAIYNFLDDFV
jgi:hypothetical protein